MYSVNINMADSSFFNETRLDDIKSFLNQLNELIKAKKIDNLRINNINTLIQNAENYIDNFNKNQPTQDSSFFKLFVALKENESFQNFQNGNTPEAQNLNNSMDKIRHGNEINRELKLESNSMPKIGFPEPIISAKKKNHTWLFATECQFDRKSQDIYNIDLEYFFEEMTQNTEYLKYFLSHKNKNYDATFTDDNNKNYSMFKYSRFEPLNNYLQLLYKENSKTLINQGNVVYSNIYLNLTDKYYEEYSKKYPNYSLSKSKEISHVKKIFFDLKCVKKNLEDCFLNLEKYPLARTYLFGKVIGKIYHKIYELTNYRRRTPALEECLTILKVSRKYEKENDNNFLRIMSSKEFWYWYSKEAMYHDQSKSSKITSDRARDALIIQKKRAYKIFLNSFKKN